MVLRLGTTRHSASDLPVSNYDTGKSDGCAGPPARSATGLTLGQRKRLGEKHAVRHPCRTPLLCACASHIDDREVGIQLAGAFAYISTRELAWEKAHVGWKTTFADDTAEFAVLAERLQPLLDKVWATAKEVGARGLTQETAAWPPRSMRPSPARTKPDAREFITAFGETRIDRRPSPLLAQRAPDRLPGKRAARHPRRGATWDISSGRPGLSHAMVRFAMASYGSSDQRRVGCHDIVL